MSGIYSLSLNRISRERLGALLLTEPTERAVVVVDVRDSDHIGGHIKSSRHAPSETLDHKDLARQLQGAEKVVFHCALSQQRGPSAALKYLREREKLLGADLSTKATTGSIDGESKERDENENENEKVKKQEIYVLDGGFVRWQEKYGDDERLTENYNKQLWADGGNY